METQVHVSAKGVELAPDQEALIREAVAGLERFFTRLVACRVVVTVPHRRPRHEAVSWTVRLSLVVPGGELAITRQAKPSFREALEDAFDAARRRLQDYARELRGDVKPHTGELQGRVTRLYGYEGYGFITGEDGGEMYFHKNSVLDGGFDRLTIGAEVRYIEAEGEQGPQASTVVLRGHPASSAPAHGEVF
jgi:cold shock CspA family protein/ribosome-associated translation inhibitor RaiA